MGASRKIRMFRNAMADMESLGDQACFLCGDLNPGGKKGEKASGLSALLEAVLRTGRWVDLGAALGPNGKSEPTYSTDPEWDKFTPGDGVTRPDYILANTRGFELVKAFELERNSGIPGHLVLKASLSVAKMVEKETVMDIPMKFPIEYARIMTAKEKTELALTAMEPFREQFDDAEKNKDADAGWRTFAKVGERYLTTRCQHLALKNGTSGRSLPPATKEQPILAPANGEVPENRELRRLHDLQKRVSKLRRTEVGQHQFTKLVEAIALWRKIRKEAERWLLRLPRGPTDETEEKPGSGWQRIDVGKIEGPIPTREEAKSLTKALSVLEELTANNQSERRKSAWAVRLSTSWNRGGADVFDWVRGPRQPPLQALKRQPKQGEAKQPATALVETSTTGRFEVLSEAWLPIFRKEKLVTPAELEASFGPLIDKKVKELGVADKAKDLPPFDLGLLRRLRNKMKRKRAVAADGWRTPEILDLPDVLLEWALRLFQLHREGASWPTSKTLGLQSHIGKGVDPADQTELLDATEVAAPEGKDTRPIVVLSPWYCLYSSMQFERRTCWREAFAPAGQQGARKKREVHNVSWRLALRLELARKEGQALSGCSEDKSKFFDTIEYDLIRWLAKKFGLPPDEWDPMENFYNDLQMRFKIGSAVSEVWKRLNGLCQGCSFSIEGALMLMTVWHWAMEAHSVETASFLDDSSFTAVGATHATEMRAAWNTSKHFAAAFGLLSNLKKTLFFSNTEDGEEELREAIEDVKDGKCPVKRNFVLVGATEVARGAPPTEGRARRMDAAWEVIRKAKHAPGGRMGRIRVCQAAGLPRGCFGVECLPLLKKRRDGLRRSLMSTLWPRGRSYRATAASLVLTVQGHLLDPIQVEMYQPLRIARRMLQGADAEALKDLLERTWRAHQRAPTVTHGPFARLLDIAATLGWTWDEPCAFGRPQGCRLHLIEQEEGWWLHEVRTEIRQHVLRTDEELHKNHEGMKGVEDANYPLTVALLRGKKRRPRKGKKSSTPEGKTLQEVYDLGKMQHATLPEATKIKIADNKRAAQAKQEMRKSITLPRDDGGDGDVHTTTADPTDRPPNQVLPVQQCPTATTATTGPTDRGSTDGDDDSSHPHSKVKGETYDFPALGQVIPSAGDSKKGQAAPPDGRAQGLNRPFPLQRSEGSASLENVGGKNQEEDKEVTMEESEDEVAPRQKCAQQRRLQATNAGTGGQHDDR